MAKKDMDKLRGLSIEELNEKLSSLRNSLLEARFKVSMGRLDKPSIIRSARKDIARIMTLKNELSAGKKGQ